MRSIIRRGAALLLLLTLLLAAATPSACAMVYGSIDRYAGGTLNVHEDSTAFITVGKTVRLRMTELVDRQIRALRAREFKSNRPSVASVSASGWMKSLRSGTAKITMKARDERQYVLTLTVIRSNTPTRIWFSQSSVTARIGTKLKLAPYLCAKPLTALLASNRVIWTSQDTKVALVSSTGVVTPRKRGTTTITAACGKLKATIRLRVKD